MASLAEYLPSKYKVLNLNPSTAKKQFKNIQYFFKCISFK
jgi:hypothetical protein